MSKTIISVLLLSVAQIITASNNCNTGKIGIGLGLMMPLGQQCCSYGPQSPLLMPSCPGNFPPMQPPFYVQPQMPCGPVPCQAPLAEVPIAPCQPSCQQPCSPQAFDPLCGLSDPFGSYV